MLAASVVCLLMKWRATEFGGPHNERSVQHTALLKVSQQSGNGLVDGFGKPLVVAHVSVRIPISTRTHIDQFQEPYATLGQSASDKALPAKALRGAAFQSIQT